MTPARFIAGCLIAALLVGAALPAAADDEPWEPEDAAAIDERLAALHGMVERLLRQGRREAAIRVAEQALALRAWARIEDLALALRLLELGALYREEGRAAAALPLHRRAVALLALMARAGAPEAPALLALARQALGALEAELAPCDAPGDDLASGPPACDASSG